MENTRKIVVGMNAGFAGTDAYEFYIVPADITEEELQDFAWQRGVEHAEMYGIYPESEYDEEEVQADPESYSDNIDGWYEDYVPEKHDGHSMRGTPDWQVY
jgi:hypothetical protein